MIEIQNITKSYKKGADVFTVLNDVSFKVEKNIFCAVIGASGSGKSTLLHTIGGLIHPDSGKVYYMNKDIYSLSRHESDSYRKIKVGFVFQQFHLMPYLTVLENIRIACLKRKHSDSIDSYLQKCSLTEQKNKYPAELSVGEKQRTAFIRAIISEPELLLADEPTGNLDPQNSTILLNLIKNFHKSGGTIILVSHDPLASAYADKTILLEKGNLVN
jgi:putative ABC transport system ATP-binding protein